MAAYGSRTRQLADTSAGPGVRLGTVSAGIKTPGRKDLVLIEAAADTHCAAVFTRNAFCAAPVTVAREHLQACGTSPAICWSIPVMPMPVPASRDRGGQRLCRCRRSAAGVASTVYCPFPPE